MSVHKRKINKKKSYRLTSEKAIEELYIEYYFSDFEGKNVFNQQTTFAELNIKKQANEIMNSINIESSISKNSIKIKGLITLKHKNIFEEIEIENTYNKIYEL